MYAHIHIHVYINTYMHIRIYICTYIYIHTYIQIQKWTSICCIYKQYIYIYIYTTCIVAYICVCIRRKLETFHLQYCGHLRNRMCLFHECAWERQKKRERELVCARVCKLPCVFLVRVCVREKREGVRECLCESTCAGLTSNHRNVYRYFYTRIYTSTVYAHIHVYWKYVCGFNFESQKCVQISVDVYMRV